MAAITSDPFIDCYRAWLKERAYSSGTAADFLESFARTSGGPHMWLCCMPGHACGEHVLQLVSAIFLDEGIGVLVTWQVAQWISGCRHGSTGGCPCSLPATAGCQAVNLTLHELPAGC